MVGDAHSWIDDARSSSGIVFMRGEKIGCEGREKKKK
jgi:hypothetical protein